MCVYVCSYISVQVLSNTVSKATGKAETVKLLNLSICSTNSFDCLNASNFTARMHSENPFKSTYRKDTYLDYL